MSARDDHKPVSHYPSAGNLVLTVGDYETMCDEIDRLRLMVQAPITLAEAVLRKAVADTFRTIAEWGSVGVDGGVTREECIELARQIETGDILRDWWSCPVCEHSECHEGCPLYPLRHPL